MTWLIFALRALDHVYAFFDRLRSALVLALASDAVLDRYNDLAFGVDTSYLPDRSGGCPELFPWEEQAIACFFPAPPARILIGGAGGGREAFVLAKRGYQIVAFEPSRPLRAALLADMSPDTPIEVYAARYGDLPRLFPAAAGMPAASLGQLGRFDAAILGWGSFVHLRSAAARVHALRAMARATDGPLLVSFLMPDGAVAAPPARLAQLGRRLLGRPALAPGDDFAMNCGYYHLTSRDELVALACRAGLSIACFDPGKASDYPHAVLCDGAYRFEQGRRGVVDAERAVLE